MNGFAELIKSRRAELGLDVDDVAAAIDRSSAVVTAWESERTFPEDPGIVEPLAKVLRLPRALLGEAYAQSSSAPGAGPEGVTALIESPAEVSRPAEAAAEAATNDERQDQTVEMPGDEMADPAPTVPAATQVATAPRPAYEPPRAVRADPIITPQQAPVPDRPESDVVERMLAMISAPFEALAGRFKRNRWTSRAPVSQLSYTEDRKQRTTYQLRAIFTGVAVLMMVLLIRWSWSQFSDAFGALWETLVNAI